MPMQDTGTWYDVLHVQSSCLFSPINLYQIIGTDPHYSYATINQLAGRFPSEFFTILTAKQTFI